MPSMWKVALDERSTVITFNDCQLLPNWKLLTLIIIITICVFIMKEHSLFQYDALDVKKHICSSDSDHINNS